MSLYPPGAVNAPEVDGVHEVRFRARCTTGTLPAERVMLAVVPEGLAVPDDYLAGMAECYPLAACDVDELPCPFDGVLDGFWDGSGGLEGKCPACGALVAAEAEAQV